MAKPKRSSRVQSVTHFQPKHIKPLTQNQQLTFDLFDKYDHLVLHGHPGTGKTFLAMYLAIKELLVEKNGYDRVIIIRSVVPVRDIGFLPGTIGEKIEVYEEPYKGIATELFGRGDAYSILKQKGMVEFTSTSFLRGETFNNAIVIVDEMENANLQELCTIATRVGDNCRIIFSGDVLQSDLQGRERNGVNQFLDILESMNEIGFVDFGIDDIVRSGFVKNFIIAKTAKGL